MQILGNIFQNVFYMNKWFHDYMTLEHPVKES